MQTALDETFSSQVQIRFETEPSLVSGVELSAGGQKISWNVSDYLVSLERSVGDLLNDQAGPDSKPGTAPAKKAKVAPETKTSDQSPAAQPQAQPA